MSTIAVAPGYQRSASRVRVGRTSARPDAAVRLTRRGRLVLLALFVGVTLAVLTVLGGQSAATGESGAPVVTRTVVVDEGDTMWEIASAVAAPGETQATIHQILELNAMDSVSLVEGQEIAVPVG